LNLSIPTSHDPIATVTDDGYVIEVWSNGLITERRDGTRDRADVGKGRDYLAYAGHWDDGAVIHRCGLCWSLYSTNKRGGDVYAPACDGHDEWHANSGERCNGCGVELQTRERVVVKWTNGTRSYHESCATQEAGAS
jgi:hypothetical protein